MIKKIKASLFEKLTLTFLILLGIFTLSFIIIINNKCLFVKNFNPQKINFDNPKNKRVEDGKKLALWNSSNYLELSIYKSNPKTVGSASSLFGLNYRDTVSINFE